ncbi:SRPBCC family protein [Falsibacillus albus]|nr:SRPBCC family protein [Falsibacillus albus]
MIKIEVNNYIERPPHEVFRYIANFENNPKWQGGMVKAKFTTPGPIEIGSTYEQTAKFLGKRIITTFKVTEFMEDQKIKIESISSSFPIQVTRYVEPSSSGTRVFAIVQGDARRFFRISEPLLKLMVSSSVKSDYRKLKKQLEG